MKGKFSTGAMIALAGSLLGLILTASLVGCGCVPTPPVPSPAPTPKPIVEPAADVQELVQPILAVVSGKDASAVAQFYRTLSETVSKEGPYAVDSTRTLRELHELTAGAYAVEHDLENKFPGLSRAINQALVDGLGLEDKPLDRQRTVDLLKGIAWACDGGSRFGSDDHIIAEGFRHWPLPSAEAVAEDPASIQQLYEQGYVGAWRSPTAEADFRTGITNAGGIARGADAAAEFKLAGTGEGKLSLPYLELLKFYPTALPGPAQQRGDCVSWSTKNGCLLSLCTEVAYGQPDEVTGHLERAPEVSDVAMANGVLSTEAFYWYRGYSGDGWSCAAAASVAVKRNGCVLRQSYPECGIDLTRYSGALAGRYGRSPPPECFQAVGKQHLIRTATELNSVEELRDFLANGYGVSTCGGESWSSQRDENGVSLRTRKGWAHAMAVIGFDDRKETQAKYGGPLVLIQNSWGKWNAGPRKVMGTDHMIPEGAFWARWQDCRNRYYVAFSSVNGWPRKQMPDYGKTKWGEKPVRMERAKLDRIYDVVEADCIAL